MVLRHKLLRSPRLAALAVLWALGGVVGMAQPAEAITLIVDRGNGQTYLKNESFVTPLFDGYSISSASNGILTSNWFSVADFYDLSSGGFVDSNSEWFKFPESSSQIAEASLTELSAAFSIDKIVPLGALWQVGGAEDFVAEVTMGAAVAELTVDYRSLTADYNNDLAVDELDYALFVSTFGSTVDLRADGNDDLVVNAADYTVWRDSPELTLSPASIAELTLRQAAIPEPGAVALLVMAATNLSAAWRPTSR